MSDTPKSTSDYVTPDMLIAMEQALADLDKQDKEIALAESAGLDMSAQKALAADHRKQALQFLAVYRSKKR